MPPCCTNYKREFNMRVIYPPSYPTFDAGEQSVFLAGSIEMGLATDWQSQVCEALADKNMLVLNPRRDDWDSSWEQTIHNEQFVAQVDWELDMLAIAERVIMYFDAATKSPISLLELGAFADSGKLIVCCPEGFWRKGNVDIVCRRHNIKMVPTLAELVEHVRSW